MQGFCETLVICCNWAGWVHILSPARYPIGIKNGLYIYIYIHIHMYMHVYHVYMCKASPLHIGTHAVIILCAWILWISPKFLLKSCSIGTWTQTPTCMYMYACIYIYTHSFSFICMHVRNAHDIFTYIYIYIYICYIPICKHCAILKVGI